MVKIERCPMAPKSLAIEAQKKNGSYSKPDVIKQLKKDFNDKCYICEMKYLQDPVVEHLLPHKNGKYKGRKFDWENLFLSCGHCNGVKKQEKYDEGILDCCKKDPEDVIIFRLIENDVCVFAIDDNQKDAALAAMLVNEIFNKQNTGMRIVNSKHRLNELQKEMNILYAKLEEYKNNPTSKSNLRTLKSILRRETAFAGFKRCYVKEHIREFPELSEYIK